MNVLTIYPPLNWAPLSCPVDIICAWKVVFYFLVPSNATLKSCHGNTGHWSQIIQQGEEVASAGLQALLAHAVVCWTGLFGDNISLQQKHSMPETPRKTVSCFQSG